MSQNSGLRSYKIQMAIGMLIYIIGAISVAYLRKKTNSSIPILALVAAISGTGVILWIFAHGKYLRGLDEFMQKLHYQALLISMGIIFAITTAFGVLEEFVKSPDIPVLPVMYVLPLYCFIYAPILFIVGRRNGVKGLCL